MKLDLAIVFVETDFDFVVALTRGWGRGKGPPTCLGKSTPGFTTHIYRRSLEGTIFFRTPGHVVAVSSRK
jgi:hypothetical protein